jgi:hypothetical protein
MEFKKIFLNLFLLIIVFISTPFPQKTFNPQWISFGQYPGVTKNCARIKDMQNGMVYAMAKGKNNSIFVGGAFLFAGGDSANNIAEWNGSLWKKLGSGIDSTVRVIAVDSSGNVYTGSISGVLEKWNGSLWSSVGTFTSGTSVPVSLLTVVVDKSGNLFAGGTFDYVNGVRVRNIAQWNGSTWNTVGTGGANNTVSTLTIDPSGDIIAGGEYTIIGSDSISYIAKWNGNKWSGLGSGLNGGVKSVISDTSGNLYIGGSFTKAGDEDMRNIALWKDSTWVPLGSGIDFAGTILAIDDADNLYVGPGHASGGSNYAIQKWNGQGWNSLGRLGGGIYSILSDEQGRLYAGGTFSSSDSSRNLSSVANWNGGKWNPLGSGIVGVIYSLCFDKSGSLLAGGGVMLPDLQPDNTTLARYKDNKWEQILGKGSNFAVTCMIKDKSGYVYTGGNIGTINGAQINGIAKYDGINWSQVGTGVDQIVLAIVSDDSGNIYIGGDFAKAGDISADRIAKWNGTAWSSMNTGMDSAVFSLAIDNSGALYAGGSFTMVSGSDFPVFARHIARWNSLQWTSLDNGILASIRAIAINPSGVVYAGSQYNVSKWNGAIWENLYDSAKSHIVSAAAFSFAQDKSGLLYIGGNKELIQWDGKNVKSFPINGTVYSLLYDSLNNYLYIGGDFSFAGDKGSCCVAAMKIEQEAPIKKTIARESVNPLRMLIMPYSSSIAIVLPVDMAGGDLFLYDISGKLIDKILKPGSNVVLWRPKANRSGCYIVAARSGKKCLAERVVVR